MTPASLPRRLPLAALVLALAGVGRGAAAQTPPSDLPPLSSPPMTGSGSPPKAAPSPSSTPATPPIAPVRPPVAAPLPSGYPYPYPYAYGAPPAYGPPNGYPYGAAPAYQRVDGEQSPLPPPAPRRRYNNGLFAGGVVALVAGMTSVFIGAYLVSAGTDRIEIYCDSSPSIPCAHKNDGSFVGGGAAAMAIGAAVAAAGLPMWFIGSRFVTIPPGEREKKAAVLPEVRVGLGSASLSLRF